MIAPLRGGCYIQSILFFESQHPTYPIIKAILLKDVIADAKSFILGTYKDVIADGKPFILETYYPEREPQHNPGIVIVVAYVLLPFSRLV